MNLNQFQAPHDIPRDELQRRYQQLYHPMTYHFAHPFTFHTLAAALDLNDWRTWVRLAGQILFGLLVTIVIAIGVTFLYVLTVGLIINCMMSMIGS